MVFKINLIQIKIRMTFSSFQNKFVNYLEHTYILLLSGQNVPSPVFIIQFTSYNSAFVIPHVGEWVL